MIVIGLGDLVISRKYMARYIRWATTYATGCIPEDMRPSGEFGLVSGDGTLRIIVPIVDAAGHWAASGIGPPCRPEWWAADTPTSH